MRFAEEKSIREAAQQLGRSEGAVKQFANIEKAANYYGVNLAETSWHDLGVHPQKNRREAAPKPP